MPAQTATAPPKGAHTPRAGWSTPLPDPAALPAAPAFEAEVVRTRMVAPHMVRVTLTHPSFGDPARFAHHAPDHLVRLLLPGTDGRLRLPESAIGWWKEALSWDEAERPVVRNYTVRSLDRVRCQLDIDFVLHLSSAGPASSWAAAAAPGSTIGVLSDRSGFAPPPTAERLLLVGDETAQPALAAIVESLPAGVEALAILESAPGSAPEIPDRPEVERVHLAPAPGAPAGTAALAHLADRTTVPCYAWVSGESALATSLRRHLVSRGVAKDRIYFCGYWRRGTSH
ncbi:siderophore-interacting protein [Nocardiopsis coralliicola]